MLQPFVPTLCDPMDCRPPGSSTHGILQARILKWVAIPFSRGSSQPRIQTHVSCIADRFFFFFYHLSHQGRLGDVWGRENKNKQTKGLMGFELLLKPYIWSWKEYICKFEYCCTQGIECMHPLPSHFSCIWLFATLWTIAHQAPLSMGFSRQEYWSGMPCPPTVDILNPNLPASACLSCTAGKFFTTAPPGTPITELSSHILSGSAGKESAYRWGRLDFIPGLGRSPGEGHSYPLQYCGLENAMDCIIHGIAKSQTQLSNFHSLS